MGLGPNHSSLLTKLGFKQAWEMSDDELYKMVAADQTRRTTERALGRAALFEATDDDGEGSYTFKRVGRPRTKSRVKSAKSGPAVETLEGCGLKADLCAKLRSSGKPDWQLILELRGAGII